MDGSYNKVTYSPLDGLASETRVIKLLPGIGDEIIQCELFQVFLDRFPVYEAVSYV
jgi:hypothetical protein